MKLQVVLEPSDEGGYTAIIPALPGCISEGDTRQEALNNIEEAIKRSTLAHILKQARLSVEEFNQLV